MRYRESAKRMPEKNLRDANWHLSARRGRNKRSSLSHAVSASKRQTRKAALHASLKMRIQQRRQSRQRLSSSAMPALLLFKQIRRGAIVSGLGKPYAKAQAMAAVNAALQSPSAIILSRIRENALRKLEHTIPQSDCDSML